MSPRINWSREELILALYWYCTKISFTKVKYTKAEVIELSQLVGRTPSSAAFKLVNFARLDPALQARGVKGMRKGSKSEEPVWNEFYNNWENLAITAERIIAERKGITVEQVSEIETKDLPKAGKERDALVKIRVNQNFFRNAVLLSYQNKCCITGISVPELLVASHIKPWAKDLSQAANPENGICLNGLHDKAFDRGLLTITEDYKIKLSGRILKSVKTEIFKDFFLPYHDKEILKPNRFMPHQIFLDYHRKNVFKF
jgi:putative restriction endonuclease